MPRYFFDIRDQDGVFRDEEGIEFESMESARREARRALSEMAREVIARHDGVELAILIRDGDEGPVLLTVTLSSIEAYRPPDSAFPTKPRRTH